MISSRVAPSKIGVENLEQHYENLKKFGIPIVIAINHFAQDTDNEIRYLSNWCDGHGYKYAFLDGFLKGGDGAVDLANRVLECLRTTKPHYQPLYSINDSIEDKISKIAKEIYRADGVDYTPEALKDIENIKKLKKEHLVVCMAKTQSSFSDNPKLLNCPHNFKVTVKEVKLSNGAEFIVVVLGSILTMPGLPKIPQATLM